MKSNQKITQEHLATKYNVTRQFVSNAILGKRTSKLALQIKRAYGHYIKQYGAELIDEASNALMTKRQAA